MEKIQIDGEIWTALRMELSNIILSQVFINDKLNKQFPSTKILYHYTTLNGLASIIDSQSIFCTNIYFLNDIKEYRYGVSLIMNVIEKLRQSKFNSKVLKTIENNAISRNEKISADNNAEIDLKTLCKNALLDILIYFISNCF